MPPEDREIWLREFLRRCEEESWHRRAPGPRKLLFEDLKDPKALAGRVISWAAREFPNRYRQMLGTPPEPKDELDRDPEYGIPPDPALAWEYLERLTSEDPPPRHPPGRNHNRP
jgi:hypothetical protein